MFKNFQHGLVFLSILLPVAAQANSPSCKNLAENDPAFANCDAVFINPPIFTNFCENTTVNGTYTLENETPVTLGLTSFLLTGSGPGTASITANTCTSSLASGASCDITVSLNSSFTGIYDSILNVGIDSRQIMVSAPPITSQVFACSVPGPIPPGPFTPTIPVTPQLPLFETAVLGSTTLTNTGITAVSGDVDLYPGTSVTGFAPGTVFNGAINIDNSTASSAHTAAQAYFNTLNALNPTFCDVTFSGAHNLIQADITATGPGVYCFDSSVGINSNLNLNGTSSQSYTFLIPTTLLVSIGTMTTSGGLLNDHINWIVGGSATVGTASPTTLYGIIDANSDITLDSSAILYGRAWSLNGAVSLDTNQVKPQGT